MEERTKAFNRVMEVRKKLSEMPAILEAREKFGPENTEALAYIIGVGDQAVETCKAQKQAIRAMSGILYIKSMCPSPQLGLFQYLVEGVPPIVVVGKEGGKFKLVVHPRYDPAVRQWLKGMPEYGSFFTLDPGKNDLKLMDTVKDVYALRQIIAQQLEVKIKELFKELSGEDW